MLGIAIQPPPTAMPNILIWPCFAKSYIFRESYQAFPTSDFRSMRQPPNGWDYEDIRMWDEMNPDWCFLPWPRIELCTCNDYTGSPSFASSQRFSSPCGASHSGENGKLTIRFLSKLPAVWLGSGIIINGNDNLAIVGCYKDFSATDMAADNTAGLLEEDNAEDLWRLSRPTLGESKSGNKRHEAKKRELQDRIAHRGRLIRRVKGLSIDPRPRKIALHDPPLIQVHPEIAKTALEHVGAMTYSSLLMKFVRLMGKDIIRVKEDLPMFCRQSPFVRGVVDSDEEEDGDNARQEENEDMDSDDMGNY